MKVRNNCKRNDNILLILQIYIKQMFEGQKVEETPSSFPNYSKNLFSKPSLALDHAKQSCKQLEDFISAFSKRVDVEMTYSKSLKDCSKLVDRYIDESSQKSLSYISSAFKVDNEQRANQAKELADSLKTEVIAPMAELAKDYSNLIKASVKSLKKLNKDYNYFKDNFERYQENYTENDIEAKEMIITKNIYKYTSEFSLQKKNKLISKTMQSVNEKKQYEKLYRTAVRQYNQIMEIYRRDVTEMLNQIQLKERQQIKLEGDCIRKLIVCEISMFKNVQYDLINISKQMQVLKVENDIELFEKNSKTIQVKNEEKDLILKEFEADKSLLTMSLRQVEDEYFVWLLSIKKNAFLRTLIEKRLKKLNIRTEEEEKEDLFENQWLNLPKNFFDCPKNGENPAEKVDNKEALNNFLSISALVNSIWVQKGEVQKQKLNQFKKLIQKSHYLRILAYLFVEEYRIQHKVQLEWENFIKASKFIGSFIEVCEAMNDTFVVKGLLGLLFTFCGTEENSKKLLYQAQPIYSCPIWKRDDFWEAAIFESTYEEMVNLSIQKGQTQAETLLREKNIIFSQLASFCHYMLMFGVATKPVKVVVGRYCRLYEMTTQQNTDLSKMIRNTFKQIKESQTNQIITITEKKDE